MLRNVLRHTYNAQTGSTVRSRQGEQEVSTSVAQSDRSPERAGTQALPTHQARSSRSSLQRFFLGCMSSSTTESIDDSQNLTRYRALLDAWVASANSDEKRARQDARACIRSWLDAGRVEEPLDLRPIRASLDISIGTLNGKITKMPPLPPQLKKLDVSGNKLKELPKKWPDTLISLDASGNNLRSLPARLPNLAYLNISYNHIKSLGKCLPASIEELIVRRQCDERTRGSHLPFRLPNSLPASLQKLDVSNNSGLENLPDFPASLVELNVSRTSIKSLPAMLSASLTRLTAVDCSRITEIPPSVLEAASRQEAPCELILRSANLSTAAQQEIDAHNARVSGSRIGREISTRVPIQPIGPVIPLNIPLNHYGVGRTSPTLEQAVEKWYGIPFTSRQAAWRDIQQEEERKANANGLSSDRTVPFWTLLDSLNETADAKIDLLSFTRRVTTLLNVMEKDQELRNICFDIVHDKVETCHDNVALGFELMEQAHLTLRAARGEFTQQAIFKVGLSAFKQQKLDELAKKKAHETGNGTEELEVMLYYRTKLADRLGLLHQTKNMRFEGTATKVNKKIVVSNKDLDEAAEQVQSAARDPQQIIEFLTEWEPWQQDLARRSPKKFSTEFLQAAKDDLHEELAAETDWGKINELDEKFKKLDDTLFRVERERLTEEFLTANTASGSQSA